MRTGRMLAVLVLAMVASFCWLLSPTRAQGDKAGASAGVGVVNIPEVFKQAKELIQLKKDFDKETEELQDEAKRRQDRIKALKAKRDAFLPDAADWKKANEELLHHTIDYRVWLEEQQNDLVFRHRLATERFYQRVMEAIRTIAVNDGFQVVLYKEDYEVRSKEIEDLIDRIRQRKVLYYSARSDLTDKVLRKLDAEFEVKPAGG